MKSSRTPASGSLGKPARDRVALLFPKLALAAGAGALLIYAAWMWHRIRVDPDLAVLRSQPGAEWIRHDEPVSLETRVGGNVVRAFKVRLEITSPPADALLHARALRHLNVVIDGKTILAPPPAMQHWKTEQVVQLAPHLAPGPHELMIIAQNQNGPVAIWARSETLSIATGASWQSSADGTQWTPARLAADRLPAAMASQFPAPLSALRDRWQVFAFVFFAVAGATYVQTGRARPAFARNLSPPTVRWVLLAAWAGLGVNNVFKLPSAAGFDVGGHLDYVSYVLNNHRVPLATDGWQMFQAPLNYLLSAPLFVMFSKLFAPATATLLLRSLPLVCGLLQVELSYRACRRVFPARDDLQILGSVFAAFLPMNIYLSQYVGNEPLAGMLSAAVFVLSLKLIRPEPSEDQRWTPLWLGILFGLALLTKVSAILIAAPLVGALIYRAWANEPGATSVKRFARSAAIVFGIAAMLAGWYYVRNWVQLGRPFVGGWDQNRGITWWQDPGFRTGGDFFAFGAALVRPICAGVESFWDGFYATFWSDSFASSAVLASAAPPWNYGYMHSGVLLALVPSLALVIGLALAVGKAWAGGAATWLLTMATVGAYGLALLHHVLTLPYYCAVKAFYTIGAMPAYVLLAVLGFELLARRPWSRAALHGLLACWALSVFLAFFAHP